MHAQPTVPSWPATWLAGLGVLAVGSLAVVYQPLLGLAFAFALLLAVIAWRFPMLAAVSLVGLAPITSGLARGYPIPGLRFSEILTVAGAGLLLLAADHRADTRWRVLDWVGFAYVTAHFGLGAAWSLGHSVALDFGSIGVLLGPAQFFLFYRALVITLQTPQRRALALRIVMLSSLLVSALAIAQAGVPPIQQFLSSVTGHVTDPGAQRTGLLRVTGPFPHFQVLSAYLAATILLSVTVLVEHTDAIMRRRYSVATLAAASVALVMTVTITTMAGTVIASLFIVARYRRRLLAPFLVAMVVLGVAFSPLLAQRYHDQTTVAVGTVGAARNPLVPETVAYRWDVWTNQSFPTVRKHLLLGVGPNLPDTVAWRSTETMYFTLLFRGGVPLLALWFALAATLMFTASRVREAADPAARVAGRGLLVLVGTLLVMQLTQPYFTYGGLGHVLWLLAALVTTERLGGNPRPLGLLSHLPSPRGRAPRAIPSSPVSPSPKLVVIVPFLNEERLLPTFLSSVDAQQSHADLLILVDDGSTDASPALVSDFARARDQVLVVTRPPRQATSDRLSTAAELSAFMDGLSRAPAVWEYVAKLDADLDLPPDHFAAMRLAFEQEPRLGIVGAFLQQRLPDGSFAREEHPVHHVRGPNKFYRRDCFDAVFPLPSILGWDTIDEVKARMLGWETRSLDLAVAPVHMRPTGTHDGALRGFARWGQCAWAMGDPPLAVAAGAAARMRKTPRILGGLAYAYGWGRAGLRKDPRAQPAVRQFFRREQYRRIRRGLRPRGFARG